LSLFFSFLFQSLFFALTPTVNFPFTLDFFVFGHSNLHSLKRYTLAASSWGGQFDPKRNHGMKFPTSKTNDKFQNPNVKGMSKPKIFGIRV
jgi:hypothetical protein